jgi:hypothetical protein
LKGEGFLSKHYVGLFGEKLLMSILLCIRTSMIKGKISKCKCFEPLDGKGNVFKKHETMFHHCENCVRL